MDSLIDTGKMPVALNFWRAPAAPSASMIPEAVFPLASSAMYSYTGIANFMSKFSYISPGFIGGCKKAYYVKNITILPYFQHKLYFLDLVGLCLPL